MPQVELPAGVVYSVEEAVERIIPYLEDTGRTAHKTIYFDGWEGLAASAVLRAIAEHPPPSVKEKFEKILHIDCSRWKSRRALQRVIADKLNLPQRVMAAFEREDEEDDFTGVDEGSRAEIGEVGRLIQSLLQCRYLVVFHNGSSDTPDFISCGIPPPEFFGSKILWTFRGRLRLNPEVKGKVDNSHLYIYRELSWGFDDREQLIMEEASEVVNYTQHKQCITPEIAAKCILYLLWLNKKGGGTMEYNWGTHASNYWVCDGIIEEGQSDDSWDVSAALHQQIRLEDCSSHKVNFRDHQYMEQWQSVVYTSERVDIIVSPKLTTLFLAAKNELPLPCKMFQQSDRLRVLKLSGCNFSFYSPPFFCCCSLRFLGLDHCKDQQQEEEEKQQERPIMEFFKSLWVLDISHMDWELDLSQDILDQMATNIREIHVKNGRIWRSNLAWRLLQNLRKLRVIKPTSSWETGLKNEFMDMMKLELLDLSGNNAIHVLPNLCGATGLKTLVLDGCVGLEHVGPEELPPSLESFSFNAGAGEDGSTTAKITRINLADSVKLVDFRLLGSMPNLEELDLSRTVVKILDLKKLGPVENLRRIFLIGCKKLCSIIWPEKGMQQLRLLCIDTGEEVVSRQTSSDSLVSQGQEKNFYAHVSIADMRFLQSLVLASGEQFRWITAPFKLNLNLSCTSTDDVKNCNKEPVGNMFINRIKQFVRSSNLHKPLISMACRIYNDISIDKIATEAGGSSALQFEPQDLHVEIGQGTINTDVVNAQGVRAIRFMMDRVMSLHVHDNSSITTVIPKHIASASGEEIGYRALKWCRVEKCPKLDTLFNTNYDEIILFDQLETIWAADLLMARSIWSRGRSYDEEETSFAKLRAIHLHMCPRLQFVLPLSWGGTLSSLETLYIVCCRDLKQVFPVESGFLKRITTRHLNSMLEFPKLKHLDLHDLSCLQQICEAKIFAPKLETVRLRGCWGLRRLPATDRRRRDGRLVDLDCERDWWNNLEWDGLYVGHHPSLFAPRHSAYYKKQFLRTTVLR